MNAEMPDNLTEMKPPGPGRDDEGPRDRQREAYDRLAGEAAEEVARRKRGTDDEDPRLLSRRQAFALVEELELRGYTVELRCHTITAVGGSWGEPVLQDKKPPYIRRDIHVRKASESDLDLSGIRHVTEIAEEAGRPVDIDGGGLRIR